MTDSIYTKSERTVKKYALRQAFQNAKERLKKHGITKVCVDSVPKHLDWDHPTTLEQLNYYAQQMYEDTCYHNGF